MKALQGLFKLDLNLKVFVPSTSNVSEANTALQTVFVQQAMELMSGLFGGATSYDAVGGWLSQRDGLVTEPVKIIESFATKEAMQKGLPKVLRLARKMKADMGQEAIALQFNGELFFIQ